MKAISHLGGSSNPVDKVTFVGNHNNYSIYNGHP